MGFFKSFFASLLAIFVTFFLLFLFVLILVVSSKKEPEPYVRNGTILEIKMGASLPERRPDDPFSILFSDPSRTPVTLRGLENNLKKAAADDRIEGIRFKVNNLSGSWNNLIALRNEILRFREETGKTVYFTTDDVGFNERSYFLATAADSIFSPPETFFQMDGFFLQTMFIHEFLENIGVEATVLRAGDFKSAVEPLFRSDLSEENREQLQAIVDNVAHIFFSAVSERSGLSREELDDIINNDPVITSRQAAELGLIDDLLYPDQIEERIKAWLSEQDFDDLRTISYGRYSRVSPESAGVERNRSDDKIALIYANGDIMPEVLDSSPFSSSTPTITANGMARNIKAALEDDDVKAIVVRINSPGGSGSTSDLIWHNIREAAKEKPVIASMGSVAASGGYYIAMAADTIVASQHTITGSIGVFGVTMNLQELLNNKLGIYFDEVTSHEGSLWLSPDKPLSPTAEQTLQQFIDDFYDIFLDRVSVSRDMSVEDVHQVAQGRVWTGNDAQTNGLVDVIGELDTALDIAAEKAGIEDYRLEVFPKPKSFMELLSGSAQTQIRYMRTPGLKELKQLDPLFLILHHDPRTPLARIPFDHIVH
ncbi:signal peptide peptidase SppA [Balneolaceae bacterium ANBcel3]|nr:signal peptide peptidase SppA [Balneolaceae bacterium ANBcel3]